MKQKNLTLDAFKKIYAEWQASDTTIREFCRTICFDEDKFYFWKKKLLDSRKFDYILIDCPPSLGLLTLNALTASDFLIIPVQAQFLAMRGMAKITNVIEIVRERLNPGLSIGGIVITQFDKRKTLNKSVSELINDSFCDKVFKTVIRDNVALAEAPIKGLNIFEYNKNSNGAKDYMDLALETKVKTIWAKAIY